MSLFSKNKAQQYAMYIKPSKKDLQISSHVETFIWVHRTEWLYLNFLAPVAGIDGSEPSASQQLFRNTGLAGLFVNT